MKNIFRIFPLEMRFFYAHTPFSSNAPSYTIMKQQILKDVDWHSTREILRQHENLAQECFLSGFSAYLQGKSTTAIIGEALFHGYERAEDVLSKLCVILDGEIKTHAEIQHIVRTHFFLFGVHKAFLARSSGKLQKEKP